MEKYLTDKQIHDLYNLSQTRGVGVLEQKSRENRQPVNQRPASCCQTAKKIQTVRRAANQAHTPLSAKPANIAFAVQPAGIQSAAKPAAANPTPGLAPGPRLSNQRLRVLQALRKQSGALAQVPKGEFGIEPRLCRRLIELTGTAGWEQPAISSESDRLRRVLSALGMDFTAINPSWPMRQRLGQDERGREIGLDYWGNQVIMVGSSMGVVVPACAGMAELDAYQFPGMEQIDFTVIREWSQETPFFIFTQVPGPFSLLAGLTAFLDFLSFTAQHPLQIKHLAKAAGEWVYEYSRLCICQGAQGIVITDDLAYNRGPWLAPSASAELFFPAYAELVRKLKDLGVPIVLHSDGDVRLLLPYFVELGFDGLHSLEPSAGNQLGEIKAQFGSKLCLMGNIDCSYLLPQGTAAEVIAQTKATLQAGAPGGGFVLSSSAGILSGDWPAENVLAMYQTAENYYRQT